MADARCSLQDLEVSTKGASGVGVSLQASHRSWNGFCQKSLVFVWGIHRFIDVYRCIQGNSFDNAVMGIAIW